MRSQVEEFVEGLELIDALTVGIGSPVLAEVDRMAAVTVAQAVAVAAGSISAVSFWNPDTGAFQTTPPSVNVGQTIGVAVYCLNPAAYAQSMRVDVEITGPAVGKRTGVAFSVPAGATAVYSNHKWQATMAGTWVVTIILLAEPA